MFLIDGTESSKTMSATSLNKNNAGSPSSSSSHSRSKRISLPAVRRILQEAKELANDESTDYTAAPLEVCPVFPTLLDKHSPV